MDPSFSIHPVFFPFLFLHRDLESADHRKEKENKQEEKKQKQSNNNQERRKKENRLRLRRVSFSSPLSPLYFHTFSILLLLARSIPRVLFLSSPSLAPLSRSHSYSYSPSLPHSRSRPGRLLSECSNPFLSSLLSTLFAIVLLLHCVQLQLHYFYSFHHTSPTSSLTSLVLLQFTLLRKNTATIISNH